VLYTEDMSIENKVAVITGAGRGVGRATALRFAQAGAKVVLFSRTQKTLDATLAHLSAAGGKGLAVRGDVASEGEVRALFRQVVETYGRVDILVNCAGEAAVRSFLEMDITVWENILATNLRGTFLCCQQAFQKMARQGGGVILNIASLAGVQGVEKFPGLSAYCASKGGVIALTEVLALEGKPLNIRVASVSPGAIDTEMLRQATPHLKANMTPEELAEILLFMADEPGRVLSGTNLEIFSNL